VPQIDLKNSYLATVGEYISVKRVEKIANAEGLVLVED
jgi:hypothetical protein